MVGSIAANLHEGSRSEYLAQFIFASFGTAVAVPHQEDSGADLYCTLTETIGQRAWPRAYFSVQVKSTADSWKFENEKSVQWLVDYPHPLFLCIVEKTSASLRLYHTFPRFYLWSFLPLPHRIELIPGTGRDGECTQWEGGEKFSLSAPILEFNIQEILQDDFHKKVKEVLLYWINYDLENLHRIKTGIYLFKMPYKYQTNGLGSGGEVTQYKAKVSEQELQPALHNLKELLAELSEKFHRNGNFGAALRGQLLLRYLFGKDYHFDLQLHQEVNKLLGFEGQYLFAGIDNCNKMIEEKLSR